MEITLVWSINVTFALVILALVAYYMLKRRELDELSRRFLLVGFFFSINELAFFYDPLIYELTKIIFFLVLFYTMVRIIALNYEMHIKLAQQGQNYEEMKARLERIRDEISGKKHG